MLLAARSFFLCLALNARRRNRLLAVQESRKESNQSSSHMISCRLPITAPCKGWISNKCYGTRYEEVEVHATTHKWRTEGHSVIHHPIYEPVDKIPTKTLFNMQLLGYMPMCIVYIRNYMRIFLESRTEQIWCKPASCQLLQQGRS